MKRLRIFLASSRELKEERTQFEIEIYRKCKRWYDKGIFLHLEIWEDLPANMSVGGSKQQDTNIMVQHSDIVVILVHTKLGMYSAQEFEVAFKQFKSNNKPFIYTYFKEIGPSLNIPHEDTLSLETFRQKLKDLGHFEVSYTHFDNLWNQFNKELDRLESIDFKEMIIERQGNEKSSTNNSTIIGRQIIQGPKSTYNENN